MNRSNKVHAEFSAIAQLCFVAIAFSAGAQSNIPVGNWRLHLSYNNIRKVELANENVFAASESGILVFHRQEKTLGTYNKLNGLSSTDITGLRYDEATDQLFIGYSDGDLDIIQGNAIRNFNRLKEANVTTSKKINHISTYGNFAYLSTSYGVVLFDLSKSEVQETWRDLGPGGGPLPVHQSTFLKDSVYLATDNGVLAGKLSDNLLDFNNWERFNGGNFNTAITSITAFNNKIYATGPAGIYRLGNNTWVQEPFLNMQVVESLDASDRNLLIISDSAIWLMNSSGNISEMKDALITAPAVVKQDGSGSFWVGDQMSGLVSDAGGSFTSYLPNGPTAADIHRMFFQGEKLYVLSGGYSASGQPSKIPGQVNIFENGSWSTATYPVSDLTDIAVNETNTFISSFGAGILVSDATGNTNSLDETNSPLKSTDPGQSTVTAVELTADGLWAANYGGNQPLHLLKGDGNWTSFSFGFPNEQHPTDLSVDALGNPWMTLDPASGGGLIVWDRTTNQGYFKTNADGNGDLPDKNINCITADRSGYTWVGTNAGVAYFFSVSEDAIKPIYENRFLLRDEKITAIEADAGNRKWIGTEQGVWLFNSTGEVLVHHFTRENSPLISDIIRDIEIHATTGEVFFATDQGIISYRSDATAPADDFEKLTIFPNPVSPGYSGIVGITGLAENAFVRITDISGKLIWQTQANGGMATWNVRDHEGRRAATGIYLVFAATEDGRESVVGKIAVIE